MFQFTTTNVINSEYEDNYIPTGNPEDEKKHVIWSAGKDPEGGEDASILVLKRIGTFKGNEVTAIYKAQPVAPKCESLTFSLMPTGAEKDDTCRVNMYIRLSQGSNDPMYANDYWFKGRPLWFEYPILDTEEKTAKNFIKTFNKFALNVQNEKLFDIELTDDNKIKLTAINEYQRFYKFTIDKLIPAANHGMGDWKTLWSISEAEDVDYIKGVEGFGTYDYILHNLRIPTSANTRYLSVHDDEAPVKGAAYVQYTIHQCSNRGQLGLNAVGLEVSSTTVHVLFVKEDLTSDFDVILNTFATNSLATKVIELDATGKPIPEPA